MTEPDRFGCHGYFQKGADNSLDMHAFRQAVIAQDRETLPDFFCSDAIIRWHCSHEQFAVEEYIQANCDYPCRWYGEIERLECLGDCTVMAGRVFPPAGTPSFHVVNFLRLKEDRILEMDEYRAEDSEAPEWRRSMGIGKPIRKSAEDIR